MTVKRVLLLVALSLSMLVLFTIGRARMSGRFAPGQRSWLVSAPSVPFAQVPALIRSLRPDYPYSVIPGGAYSREELVRWMRRDPIVREHYRDFDRSTVRIIAAAEDVDAHVSYRKQDAILWTRRKLHIPKGELLITDGVHLARARCGNRLESQLPPGELSRTPAEPANLLDLPPFTPALLVRNLIPLAPPEITGPAVFPSLPLQFDIPAGPSPWPSPASPWEDREAQDGRAAFLVQAALPLATLLSGSSLPGKPGVTGTAPPTIPLGVPPVSQSAVAPEPRSVGVAGLLLLLCALILRRANRSRRQRALSRFNK